MEPEGLVLLVRLLVRPLGLTVPVGDGGCFSVVVGDPAVMERIEICEPDESPEEDVVEAGGNVHVGSLLTYGRK